MSLSSPAVKRRVDRLRSSGAITGFTAIVDPGALGHHTEAFVEVRCERSALGLMFASPARRRSSCSAG